MLLYGDVGENCTTSPDQSVLTNKFPISEFKDLVIGKDCIHAKDTRSKKSVTNEFTFCIVPFSGHEQALHFVAPDEKTYCYWLDGINCLLKRDMSSEEAKKDMDTLMSMHVAIQLLDMDGLQVPSKKPETPPLPSNLAFSRQYST